MAHTTKPKPKSENSPMNLASSSNSPSLQLDAWCEDGVWYGTAPWCSDIIEAATWEELYWALIAKRFLAD